MSTVDRVEREAGHMVITNESYQVVPSRTRVVLGTVYESRTPTPLLGVGYDSRFDTTGISLSRTRQQIFSPSVERARTPHSDTIPGHRHTRRVRLRALAFGTVAGPAARGFLARRSRHRCSWSAIGRRGRSAARVRAPGQEPGAVRGHAGGRPVLKVEMERKCLSRRDLVPNMDFGTGRLWPLSRCERMSYGVDEGASNENLTSLTPASI